MRASIDGLPFLDDVLYARCIGERMRGLLGKDGLPDGSAMLIEPCGSIHTFFMRFDLDLIFLDSKDRVVRVVTGVRPGRMAFGGFGAKKVLEAEAGGVNLKLIREGCQIQFSEE